MEPGESRKLPYLIPQRYYVLAYEFCYNESNDDFKVFSIFRPYDPNLEYEILVYCLKSNGWRKIGDFPYAGNLYTMYWKGMFANETIHWVMRPDEKSKIIVSLDIKTETFGEVLHPNYGEDACRWTLGTFGKSLSFCKFGSTHADFLVMKKCGTEESWTKLFTILYMDRPTWLSRVTHIELLIEIRT